MSMETDKHECASTSMPENKTINALGGIMKEKVELISWTQNPIETIWLLWEASRTQKELPSMDELKSHMKREVPKEFEVREIFIKILESAIPVSENISFTFLLKNVSIAFREQLVRHRIGVKVGDRVGMDYFPDIHDSTWWSQSMRVLNMGEFADKEAYHIPENIKKDPELLDSYKEHMHQCQIEYKNLVANGVPAEEARQVLPLATQHRISWTLNLATLSHIVKKRSCSILQLSFWEPVIMGMIEELCEKVDPIFRDLVTPPCMKKDDFVGCKFELDNEKRLEGSDPLPCCALWASKTGQDIAKLKATRPDFLEMCKKYESFWRRNVFNGKKL